MTDLEIARQAKLKRVSELRSAESLTLLVKGDPGLIEKAVISLGGTLRYSIGDISSITIPSDQLILFSGHSFVQRIEGLYYQFFFSTCN